MMKINKKGQSKIEYAQLYIMIFIAFLMMGPYIIRGINALFQSFDDQVQDSFSDPHNQAAVEDFHLPTVIATH